VDWLFQNLTIKGKRAESLNCILWTWLSLTNPMPSYSKAWFGNKTWGRKTEGRACTQFVQIMAKYCDSRQQLFLSQQCWEQYGQFFQSW
jgi:hypothetical protein